MVTKNNLIFKLIYSFFFISYNISIVFSLPLYFGNQIYFLILCFLINFLLYISFFKSDFFYNIFISIFILFGYGFKFTLSLIFYTKYNFYNFTTNLDSDGGFLRLLAQKLLEKNKCLPDNFNALSSNFHIIEYTCENPYDLIYNVNLYDKGLLISIVGISSIIFSIFAFEIITRKKNFNFFKKKIKTNSFYERIRKPLFLSMIFIIISIGYFNLEYSIYQRGIKSNDFIPFLKPIISWLLLFGLTSFICNILYLEYKRGGKSFKIIFFFSFLEPFISNTSMLSRGFVFNSLSIILGFLKKCKNFSFLYFLSTMIFVFCLFILSIYITENNRLNKFSTNIDNTNNITVSIKNFNNKVELKKLENNPKSNISPFFSSTLENDKINFISQVLIERWVGLEEVMLTADSDKIGWSFLKKSFNEKQKQNKPSMFDREIYGENLSIDRTKHNYTSIPGIIAFSFFSNNLIFLFIFILSVTFFCLTIELITKIISYNNLFLSALIGQILAFRIIHFGVYPIESYKIILAISLTLIISFSFSKFFLTKN